MIAGGGRDAKAFHISNDSHLVTTIQNESKSYLSKSLALALSNDSVLSLEGRSTTMKGPRRKRSRQLQTLLPFFVLAVWLEVPRTSSFILNNQKADHSISNLVSESPPLLPPFAACEASSSLLQEREIECFSNDAQDLLSIQKGCCVEFLLDRVLDTNESTGFANERRLAMNNHCILDGNNDDGTRFISLVDDKGSIESPKTTAARSVVMQRAAHLAAVQTRRRKNTHCKSTLRESSKAVSKVSNVLRNTVRVATAANDAFRVSDAKLYGISNSPSQVEKPTFVSKSLVITQSVVQTVVQKLFDRQQLTSTEQSLPSTPFAGPSNHTAAFSSFQRQYGPYLHNDIADDEDDDDDSILRPGSVLSLASDCDNGQEDKLVVRVATPDDDYDIACLRLSVFTELTSDRLQHQFRIRSCQAMQSRRLRGARCLVAIEQKTSHQLDSVVLGSVECSFHEFFGTRLGQRRRRNTILYVTEVAVRPEVRRRGIGRMLLQGCDAFAKARGAETLYLHVDVANRPAIQLYERAGYKRIAFADNDPMFLEFTTSLNLHPGATQGRNHHLLCKDLVAEPSWLDEEARHLQVDTRKVLQGSMTFEVSA